MLGRCGTDAVYLLKPVLVQSTHYVCCLEQLLAFIYVGQTGQHARLLGQPVPSTNHLYDV